MVAVECTPGWRQARPGRLTTEDPPNPLPGQASCSPFQDQCGSAIDAEAAKQEVDVMVALGREGASGGTLSEPTGPLIDIADHVVKVDAVIGDRNDIRVLSLRPNGVLVTQNRGKGIRFTRIRLVYDEKINRVIYKTADLRQPLEHRRDAERGYQDQDRPAERAAGAAPLASQSAARAAPSHAPAPAVGPTGACAGR